MPPPGIALSLAASAAVDTPVGARTVISPISGTDLPAGRAPSLAIPACTAALAAEAMCPWG